MSSAVTLFTFSLISNERKQLPTEKNLWQPINRFRKLDALGISMEQKRLILRNFEAYCRVAQEADICLLQKNSAFLESSHVINWNNSHSACSHFSRNFSTFQSRNVSLDWSNDSGVIQNWFFRFKIYIPCSKRGIIETAGVYSIVENKYLFVDWFFLTKTLLGCLYYFLASPSFSLSPDNSLPDVFQ